MNKNKFLIVLSFLIPLFCLWGIFALNPNEGSVSLFFNSQNLVINSPQNTTYNFLSEGNYTLLMNVTSAFLLDSLSYKLYDINNHIEREGNISNGGGSSYSISGNFNAYRFSNLLTVFGEDINGQLHNNSVTFFVNLTNSAPLIQNLSDEIYVCENSYLSHFFTSYDSDGDNLEVDISPKYPFYVHPYLYTNATTLVSEIYSGILRKSSVGLYERIVSVNDGQYSDYNGVNITVIEVNNAPVVQSIGVQTIWLAGENSTLNNTISVTDIEDGNPDSGKLNLSISFTGKNLFNLTQNSSLLYFKPTLADLGVYNISFCAKDNSLSNIHPNISLCSQNGSSITSCINFSLTVTNENRAPTIISYFPNNLTQIINENDLINFNITKYDPDGTIPDSYWYLDNSLIYYFSGSSQDFFNYVFGCSLAGSHKVKVEITDGVLNDSLSWNVSVSSAGCPVTPPSGGGGGGGGSMCIKKLACDNWAVCQNSKESLQAGILSGEDYRIIKEFCDKNGYDETNCGIQMRICQDINNCTKFFQKQEILRECFFSLNPSCSDGIKNCHDKECEILVDCGGPCSLCPTCSDKIQNQKEEGIDCGGPCPFDCQKEMPMKYPSKNFFMLLIILILIIMILYIIRKIYLIKQEKKRVVHEYFKNKNE